jgi:hypothetical protein
LRAAGNGEEELVLDRQMRTSSAIVMLPSAPREVVPRFGMIMSLTTELDSKAK